MMPVPTHSLSLLLLAGTILMVVATSAAITYVATTKHWYGIVMGALSGCLALLWLTPVGDAYEARYWRGILAIWLVALATTGIYDWVTGGRRFEKQELGGDAQGRFRFGLRSVLGFVLICCLVFSWIMNVVNRSPSGGAPWLVQERPRHFQLGLADDHRTLFFEGGLATDEDLPGLIAEWRGHEDLRMLTIAGADISPEGMEAIQSALPKLQSLEVSD